MRMSLLVSLQLPNISLSSDSNTNYQIANIEIEHKPKDTPIKNISIKYGLKVLVK